MRVVIGGKVVRFYWRKEPRSPRIIRSRIFGSIRRIIPKPISEPAGWYGNHVRGKPGEVPNSPMPPKDKQWQTTWPEVWWFQVPGFYGNSRPKHA